jgi:hypothetical protein
MPGIAAGKDVRRRSNRGINPLATYESIVDTGFMPGIAAGKDVRRRSNRGINPLATYESIVETGFMPGIAAGKDVRRRSNRGINPLATDRIEARRCIGFEPYSVNPVYLPRALRPKRLVVETKCPFFRNPE